MGKIRQVERAGEKRRTSRAGLAKETPGHPFAWSEAASLAILTLIAFAPVFRAGYVWDDVAMTKNPMVHTWEGIGKIWLHPGENLKEDHYWPITYSTFWLEDKVWGDRAPGYHAVNLLLHLANVLILWRLFGRLNVPGAWLAAAVFAVHPVHVESVTWVIERKDVLSAFFYLLTALCFLNFEERGAVKFFAGAAVCFLAAMLSKSVVVTLPIALLIILWWKRREISGRAVMLLGALALIAAIVTFSDLVYLHQRTQYNPNLAFAQKIHVVGRSTWFYFEKLLWPANLMTIYPRWNLNVSQIGFCIFAAGLLGALAVAWKFREEFGRGAIAAAAFFLLTLAPTSGLIGYGFMKHSFVADRFEYLASAGLIVLIVAIGTKLADKLLLNSKEINRIAAGAVLACLALVTFRQTILYKNNETLFSYNISKNPHAGLAYNNLGVGLADRGLLDQAAEMYEKALEFDPDNKDAANNLGVMLDKAGKNEEAKKFYASVIEKTGSPDSLSNMGSIVLDEGRIDEAIQYFQKALEMDPNALDALTGMGAAKLNQGRPEEAAVFFNRAIKFQPNAPKALAGLGSIRLQEGKIAEALDLFDRGLAADPKMQDALVGRGLALAQTGRLEEAIASYQKAIQIMPKYADAHNALAVAQQMLGKLDDSIASYRRALEARPDYVDALAGLGSSLAQKGNIEEATSVLNRAIQLNPNHADAQNTLGTVLLRQGHVPEAVEHFQRTLAEDPHHINALSNMGLVFSRQGKFVEAEEFYRRAANVPGPHVARSLANLGGVLLDEGKPAEAVKSINRALELEPNNARALNYLGVAKLKEGNRAEAAAFFKKALAAMPDYAEARTNLQKAEGTTP